jgi:hypothetical protein
LLQITAQCGAKIGEPVKLPLLGLTPAAVDWSKVVTINGRRAGGDGAGGALSAITLISGYTIFWCYIW